MVRKNSTKAGEKSTETLETAMTNGSEAFKMGFEKAVKGYDQFWDYGRETVEAYVKAKGGTFPSRAFRARGSSDPGAAPAVVRRSRSRAR